MTDKIKPEDIEQPKIAKGRYGLLLGIPAAGFALIGGGMLAVAAIGQGEQREFPKPPQTYGALSDLEPGAFADPPPETKMVDASPQFAPSLYTPEPVSTEQAAQGPTPAPPPEDIQQQIAQMQTAPQTVSAPPKPRRVVSEIAVMQVADASSGGTQAVAGGRSAIFSTATLEQPFGVQVNAGTPVPAMMTGQINTQAAGYVKAIVTEDVFDARKDCVAIPRGTEFFGPYNVEVGRGESRAEVAWTAMTRPPPMGDTIALDATFASETDGTTGLEGDVDSNIPWGMMIASSILDLGKAAVGPALGATVAIGNVFGKNVADPLEEVAKDHYSKARPSISVEAKPILITLSQHLPMSCFSKG